MNLPLVLDVLIGLIFVYLILSLLASEIQEIITTIFQWRAKHLKESIEVLLAGGAGEEEEINRVEKLVNKLYDDPLLKNINQEAKGTVEKTFRKMTWWSSEMYRKLTHKKEGVFGDKRSGPSYISSDTFATTLMETLNVSVLVENLVELRFNNFIKTIENGIRNIAETSGVDISSNENLKFLQEEFADIIYAFKNQKATLATSIDRLSESLDKYINSYSEEDEYYSNYRYRIQSFKQGLFGDKNERAILSGGLKPSLFEIIETINIGSNIHREIKETMLAKDSETYEKIAEVLKDLPVSVQKSLAVLARRAQTKAKRAEDEINQMREEIALWFDRSMERASGVYKRNAKGVAILIGFCIALAVNADTLHIVSRLSSDENLRQIVTERASRVRANPDNPASAREQLEDLKDQTNQVLEDITLPLSWNAANLGQQFNCSPSSIPENDEQDWSTLFNSCIPGEQAAAPFVPQKIAELGIKRPWLTLKIILGWLLSGLAIAMGAPFWFDLLNKVVNVRNTGTPPRSAADHANPE